MPTSPNIVLFSRKVLDRSLSREQRIQACSELQNAVDRYLIEENHVPPIELLNDLLSVLSHRFGSLDLKRRVGILIQHILTYSSDQLLAFVSVVRDGINNCHAKADEELAIMLRSLALGVTGHCQVTASHGDKAFEEVMKIATSLLDENNSHIVHCALMDVCHAVVVTNPNVFQNYFEDVVDCTVGWMVEDKLPRSVNEHCEKLISVMKEMWLQRPEYAIDLLSQFRTDIDTELRELGDPVSSVLKRSAALVRVQTTILRIFVQTDAFWPGVVKPAITQMKQYMVEYADLLHDVNHPDCPTFFASMSHIIEIILEVTHKKKFPVLRELCETSVLILAKFPSSATIRNAFFQSYVKIHQVLEAEQLQFFAQLLLDLPPDANKQLLDAYPLLCGLSNSSTMSSSSKLLSAMLPEANLPYLQLTYTYVRSAFEYCINILRQASTLNGNVKNRRFSSDVQSAETCFIGLLKSLTHVSKVKNSFVVMMGLTPPLFVLFTERLPLKERWIIDAFPHIHSALLTATFMHCKWHDFFLANSSWVMSSPTSIHIGLNLTASHAETQLKILTQLVNVKLLPTVKKRLDRWLTGLIEGVPKNTLSTMIGHPEFVTLREKLYPVILSDPERAQRLCGVWRLLGGDEVGSDELCIARLFLAREHIQTLDPTAASKVWANLPTTSLIKAGICGWDQSGMCQQKTITPCRFSTEDFSLITHFLLHRQLPTLHIDDSTDDEWMLHSIAQIYSQSKGDAGGEKKERKLMSKWRWALAQTANHCIENRMRTQYGSPMETFTEFSKEIHRLAREAISGEKVPDQWDNAKERNAPLPIRRRDRDNEDDDGIEMRDPRSLTPSEEWWRVRCLLEFLSVLEKLIFNAYSGTTFPIAEVSQSARNFFVANQNACVEWLHRTYVPAMVVAYHNGYYAQVILFGKAVLAEFERKSIKGRTMSPSQEGEGAGGEQSPTGSIPGAIQATIEWTVKAMLELGADQSMLGVRAWALRVCRVDMEWISAASYAASGRWEVAIVELKKALQSVEQSSSVAKVIRSLLVECVCRLRIPDLVNPYHCPPHLSLWEEIAQGEAVPDIPHEFDEQAFTRARELCVFGKVDRIPSNQLMGWWTPQRLQRVEHKLMTTLRRSDVIEIQGGLARDANLALAADEGLRLHTRIAALHLVSSVLSSRMVKNFDTPDAPVLRKPSDLNPLFLVDDVKCEVGERLLLGRQLMQWAERLASGGQPPTIESQLALARLARKTENRYLSELYLNKATSNPNPLEGNPLFTSLEYHRQLAKMCDGVSYDARAPHFYPLFMYSAAVLGQNQQNGVNNMMATNGGFDVMAASFVPGSTQLASNPLPHSSTPGSVMAAKSLLRIADWLNETPELINAISSDCMNTSLWADLTATLPTVGGNWEGAFISVAARTAPSVSKTHRKLGDWALRCASATFPNERAIFESNYKMLLGASQDAIASVDPLWKAFTESTHVAQLHEKVQQALAGNPVAINRILYDVPHFTTMWDKMNERRTGLLKLAVDSFFNYIFYKGTNEDELTGSVGTVSSALSILDLLVKHTHILHDVIDSGLQRTNEHLWKDILPQLFARLSHPSKAVRESLVVLLKRIGQAAPHSVVYQIVVGASQQMLVDGEQDGVLGEGNIEEEESHEKERSLMWECCSQLETHLSAKFPEMVRDVREFVAELQRINLLNEERWAFILANIGYDMEKRMEQIKAETEATFSAEHLSEKERVEIVQEKTTLITSSIYRLLDDLYERTCVTEPVTANEKQFVEQYGQQLTSAFEQSKASRKNPEKAWAPFRQLLATLLQRTTRRGGQCLQMSDVSVKLSAMKNSHVPIPGQERKHFSEVLTLDHVGKHALVLPTKTRPKKISLIGNDGTEQFFLFKGQEDLHLDERIMQMLQICNLMLKGNSITRRCVPTYEARHYSVTPLGVRSALIQWVTGSTPLFQLYRKWQIRQNAIKNALEKRNGTWNGGSEIERPTEMYAQAMKKAFKKHQIDSEVLCDRSRWPPAVVAEVLLHLISHTPKDLLSRELWMRTGGADSWWSVQNRMARSTAVMSMVGSILGLGDRHLDNLLVNLETGQMIHIDYNVCFDKGAHLRVPETVPFRLTQNIVTALGPTGTDGIFRESCADVLTVLREGGQTLLTILDAFVYDPLVDWTSQDHLVSSAASVNMAVALAVYGGDWRAADARNIARQMFTVRVRELAVPWNLNRNVLRIALEDVVRVLERETITGDCREEDEEERVTAGRRLKTVISQHNGHMKNFRPLLKALASCDERFAAYLVGYRENFSSPLVKGHQMLDSQPRDVVGCVELFTHVLAHIDSIYSDLLALDSKVLPTVNKQQADANAAPPGLDSMPGHKVQQEQNPHAKAVSRRVRARLEGKIDHQDPVRSLNPHEQADALIAQATSLSNLSLMYEGWTAWV